MATRPSREKDTAPKAAPRAATKKTAAKKAASTKKASKKSTSSSDTAQDQAQSTSNGNQQSSYRAEKPEGISSETTAALKQGVSRFLSKSRQVIANNGPQILDTLEKSTHIAIDGTAKGIEVVERTANQLEDRISKGLSSLLKNRRDGQGKNDDKGPKGPRV